MADDIAMWLEGLGLGEYAPAFADNSVELQHLRHLSEDDLKELGLPLGPRRHLQAAITELADAPTIASLVTADSKAEEFAPAEAERRQLTVLFCDLVGSTALAAQLDPEDMRAIIGDYHRCCAETIERNGGFVAKYMGDGVLAYFGYPNAHEHDAERAVNAGLSLTNVVPKLPTMADSPLNVRVGIATGMVVVGDLIGSGEAQERGVVGDTPNLAARLQSIAQPGMVVIAESTRRLVGNLFELDDLGGQTSRASKAQREPGRRSAPVRWKVASMRCAPVARSRSSAEKRNPNCSCGVGPEQNRGKVRSSCSRASRELENRILPRR
jgi:class 3 adenylate cyclase